MEHQKEAVKKLSSGKVLYGGTGSGKTATALAYYVDNEEFRDIYVITTAKKRDSLDWEAEAAKYGISTDVSVYGRIHIDSWNNISKYEDVDDAFFVFDEQRVVGHGAWVKSFFKITKKNHWLLLSATPGDTWLDYAPVFIANGYYKNITHFKQRHVRYEPYLKYPKVKEYLDEETLEKLRNEVLVEMPFDSHTRRALNWWPVSYDKEAFKRVWKDRWNIYEDRPIKDAGEMYWLMRRVVNSDPSRLEEVKALHRLHPRLIVFYNFNYELEILRELIFEFTGDVYEWNGHVKNHLSEFEDHERWIYLVQYVAGAEAWNCVSTDAMVLYSLTYSYKNFEQAQGRIDRMNTKYNVLHYYIFVSNSVIDRAVKASLDRKESFNERKNVSNLERFEMEDGFGAQNGPVLRENRTSDKSDKTTDEERLLAAKYGVDLEAFLETCQI